MSILGDFKKKAEQKKAFAFYKQLGTIKGNPRDIRNLKSLMSARLTAFIDATFIDGAKKTESLQESGKPLSSLPKASSYKDVKTISGIVCVYLPEKHAQFFFELGSRYQSASLTLNQVVELADEMAAEISASLTLDRPVMPLNFLRSTESEDEEGEAGTTED